LAAAQFLLLLLLAAAMLMTSSRGGEACAFVVSYPIQSISTIPRRASNEGFCLGLRSICFHDHQQSRAAAHHHTNVLSRPKRRRSRYTRSRDGCLFLGSMIPSQSRSTAEAKISNNTNNTTILRNDDDVSNNHNNNRTIRRMQIIQHLRDNFHHPYHIKASDWFGNHGNDDDDGSNEENEDATVSLLGQGSLVVRLLELTDVPAAVDLCIEEYGIETTTQLQAQPQSQDSSRSSPAFDAPNGSFDPFSVSSTSSSTSSTTSNRNAEAQVNEFSDVLPSGVNSAFDDYENYALGNLVKIGMEQRIAVRKKGQQQSQSQLQSQSSKNTSPSPVDHNVFCIEFVPDSHPHINNENHEPSTHNDVGVYRQTPPSSKSKLSEIIAMAEVSLQPPFCTAPPLVMPYPIKVAQGMWERWTHRTSHFSFLAQFEKATTTKNENDEHKKASNEANVEAYVSNVLVRKRFRSQGLAQLLMAALECQAMCASGMNRNQVTLHCDANESSGQAPQQLYFKLGYEPIVEEGKATVKSNNRGNNIHDNDSFRNAVYMVEGIPLLYLKKDLY
jgi:GNAT superfamily N-acetyltransferase